MSTQNTGFISNNQDLSEIFYPLTGSAATTNTGYQYYDTTTLSYKDLINLFEPYSSGNQANPTHYISIPNNNSDLNLIFQNISFPPVPLFTTTGNPTITYPTSTEYIVQFTDTTVIDYSITFNKVPTNFSYIVVGGGGSGGSGSDPGGTVGIAGGGGGGGQVLTSTFSPSINTPYTVTVGIAGPFCYNLTNDDPAIYTGGQSPTYTYGNGGNSAFNTITASGGYSGQGTIYYVVVDPAKYSYNENRNSSPIGGYNGENIISGGNGYYSISSTYDYGTVGTNGTNFNIYGNSYTFGGGGGGGNYNSSLSGGSGGGGDGGTSADEPLPGTSNTGGGGGGSGVYLNIFNGGAGGSGTVVLYFDYN